MPDNKEIIDVHCHLFNVHYGIMEFIAATWNNCLGEYPHKNSGGLKAAGTTIQAPHEVKKIILEHPGVQEFAAKIARLITAATSSCEENYSAELEKFKLSSFGGGSSLVVAPLMMDIYFAWDDNKDEDIVIGTRTANQFEIHEDLVGDFKDHVDSIKNIVKGELEKLSGSTEQHLRLDPFFDYAHKEMIQHYEKLQKANMYDGIELSPGYMKHMHELEELSEKHTDKVFPFLAVDPRRIGIMELIKMKVKVKGGNGIFKGIKLYPPLGYLPTHPNLRPIFAYCETHKIPITLHCSEGGMKNFRDKNYVTSWEGNNQWVDFDGNDKSYYYTAPEKWLPVLKDFPDLFINFAHFGGGDQFDKDNQGGSKWMNRIIKMMNKDNHVYTDIAYFPNANLTQIQKTINENPILNSRLMFGTDYDIMEDIGLDKYFDKFSILDIKLLNDNARDFLGYGRSNKSEPEFMETLGKK